MKTENAKLAIYWKTNSIFLLECPLYSDSRKLYINRYYLRRLNMPKFIELLISEHVKTLKNLSVFVDKAFKIRKEALLL